MQVLRLVCGVTLLLGLATAPAHADTPGTPAPPPTIGYVAEDDASVTYSWTASPSADVTSYQMQVSHDDGATWADVPGASTTDLQLAVPLPSAGQVLEYAVVAVDPAGESAPTATYPIYTPGTTTQRFKIVTSTGVPVSHGTIEWSDGYGTWHDAPQSNADGEVTLSGVPAGISELLEMSDGNLPNNQTVYKEWSLDFGTDEQTLVVPPPPPMETHKVTVTMPGGVPAVGVEVNAWYEEGLVDFTTVDGFQYNDFNSVDDATTGATGSAVVRGWSPAGIQFIPPSDYPYPEQAVFLYYNDGHVHAESTVLLTGADTQAQIAPLPWTSTTQPDPVDAGDTTYLSFHVHAAPGVRAAGISAAARTATKTATKSLAGVRVTVKPPAGWSAKRCKRASVLTGVSNKAGLVRLPVCASRSGAFKVATSGALPTPAVVVRVRRAAPASPATATAKTTSNGAVTVAWTAPTYTGGTAVNRYRLVARSPGHKSSTWTSASTTRSHTFTGLTRAAVWTVAVYAVNKYGTGNARSATVRVR